MPQQTLSHGGITRAFQRCDLVSDPANAGLIILTGVKPLLLAHVAEINIQPLNLGGSRHRQRPRIERRGFQRAQLRGGAVGQIRHGK